MKPAPADLYGVSQDPRPPRADDALGYHAAELILETDPYTRAQIESLRTRREGSRPTDGRPPQDDQDLSSQP